MIRAGGEEVYELEVGAGFWTRGKGGECGEDGCVFVEFCGGDSNQRSCTIASN